MKKNKESLCLIKCRFWGDYHNHNWGYKSRLERICEKCGRREINISDNDDCPDWRKKY